MMNSYAQVPKTWDMDENGLLGVSFIFSSIDSCS